MKTFVSILWASPWSAVGLLIGLVALATGGRGQRRGRVIEFYGGFAAWLLGRLPGPPFAMTLGHSILGVTAGALDHSREHELIHVRQYERWGPVFIPAYLGWSLVLWMQGRDPYLDNPFEREAFEREGDRA